MDRGGSVRYNYKIMSRIFMRWSFYLLRMNQSGPLCGHIGLISRQNNFCRFNKFKLLRFMFNDKTCTFIEYNIYTKHLIFQF